ncbi:MAG: cobaltochelatase subunit CobN, partial [Candidatus Methanomethylophilaceae archaeon]|nr:cobaltochelatase subunit CobN [Candidatus Methanomethylophilaceae archaeon]
MRILNIICDMQDNGLTPNAAKRIKDDGHSIDVWQFGTSDIDSHEKYFAEAVGVLDDCALVIIRVHAGLTYFKKFDRLKDEISKKGISLIVQSELPEDVRENRPLFRGSEEDYVAIRTYIELGGSDNEYNLLAWLLREIDGADIDVKAPSRHPAQGIYLPNVDDVKDIPLKDVNVAVVFNQNNVVNDNLAHIDALIEELGSRDVGVIPIYLTPNPSDILGSIGINESLRRYLPTDIRRSLGSIVLALPFSQLCLSDPGDGTERVRENIFDEIGV